MASTDLLIGSYPNLPSQTLSVNAGGVEALVMAAGNYYLFGDGPPNDLCYALATALNTHSNLSGVSVFIQENLHIRIQGGATAFTVQWPADNVLRNLLGFTGNLASATSHTAPNISPLLWSANRHATREGRIDSRGIPVHDTAVGQSATGVVRAISHNSYRRDTLIWRYIVNSRVWTTAEAGGEFFAFFQQVLRLLRRFQMWRCTESTSTDEMSFSSSPAMGCLVYAPTSQQIALPWAREFGFVEYLHPVTIPVVSAPDYES